MGFERNIWLYVFRAVGAFDFLAHYHANVELVAFFLLFLFLATNDYINV